MPTVNMAQEDRLCWNSWLDTTPRFVSGPLSNIFCQLPFLETEKVRTLRSVVLSFH